MHPERTSTVCSPPATLPPTILARARVHYFRLAAALALTGLLTASACGGGATPEAKTAEDGEESSESELADSEPSEESEEEEAAPRVSCDDGTCFTCGTNICLDGWYCDESAKGGPACGWHPDCIKKPSCACFKKALGAGCSCEERGSEVHVTCS